MTGSVETIINIGLLIVFCGLGGLVLTFAWVLFFHVIPSIERTETVIATLLVQQAKAYDRRPILTDRANRIRPDDGEPS